MSFKHLHWIHVCGSVPNDYILTSHLIVPFSLRWYFNFFLTFNSSIVTLGITNITCDYTFVTFGSFLICFSYLMVPLTYWVVLTSHLTVFCHIRLYLYFFSHLIVLSSNCVVPISHVIVLLSHQWFPYFFSLTFDDSCVTLDSTNIFFYRTFSHIRWYFNFYSHLTILSSH